PEIRMEGVNFSNIGLAGKWTMTDTFLSGWPVDLAAKFFVTKTVLKYDQDVTQPATGTATIEYDGTMKGLQVLMSKSFILFEPYIGLGYLMSEGRLGAESNASIFGGDLTGETSARSSENSFQYMVGAE